MATELLSARKGLSVSDEADATYVERGAEMVVAKTAAYDLAAADIGKRITNKGASARVDLSLPECAAGLRFGPIIVENENGIRVIAKAGDTIRVGNAVSAAGGYAESFAPGSALILEGIDAAQWIAVPADLNWQPT